MPLIDMKLSKKEAKGDAPELSERPRYPYGLSLNLGEEEIEKLGIKDLPKVGDSKMVIAFVDVSSTSDNKSFDGKTRRNISLQITQMSIEEKVGKDVLTKLYGDDKK